LRTAHALESLTHLLGPIQELLTGDFAVRDIQVAGDHVKHELLPLVGDIGSGHYVFPARKLVPAFGRVEIHHAAEPATPATTLEATTTALEASASALEATTPSRESAANIAPRTSTWPASARLLAHLRHSSGRTKEQNRRANQQIAT
jgi:hypothetical protein